MSESPFPKMPPSEAEYSRKVSIVGIGETDYHADYRAEREKREGWQPASVEEQSRKAFDRALADSGLKRSDIDGLAMSYTFGGPAPENMAQVLSIEPRLCWRNGSVMAGPLPAAAGKVISGEANVIALIFGLATRSSGMQFGGATYGKGGSPGPLSYYYYHPWGWSSQAAHWALMAQRYFATYGKGEEDLAPVAMTVRHHASMEPNAVMQTPFTPSNTAPPKSV